MSVKEKILAEIERRSISGELGRLVYTPNELCEWLWQMGAIPPEEAKTLLNLAQWITQHIPDEPEGVKKYAVYDNNDPISIFPLTATGKDFARITKCLLPPKHNPRVIEVEIREVKK